MEEGAFGFRARLLLSCEALLRNFHLFDLCFLLCHEAVGLRFRSHTLAS